MSNFRAINQPSESPPKPNSRKQPLSGVVSQQSCETNGGNIGQAVAKAKKATHTPRKKKRNSEASMSKVRRHQAPRNKKLVFSIERSARKSNASSASDHGNEGAEDSDYFPSPAELADTASTTASNTPSRRSPRKHIYPCLHIECSAISGSTPGASPLQSPPRADGKLAFVKSETTIVTQSSPNSEVAVTPGPHSPSIRDVQVRQKRYEEAEFVEIPKEVFDYKTKKAMRQQVAAKEEAVMAGKRKENGKVAEQNLVEESTRNRNKRRAEDEIDHNKTRKRQKSQKPDLDDNSVTDDSNVFSEGPQPSKQSSARRSPKGKIVERQCKKYEAVVVKAEDRSEMTGVRSHADFENKSHTSEGPRNKKVQRAFELQVPEEWSSQPECQASRDNGQQKKSLTGDWRKPYQRREVSVPERPRICSCALLPEYFTSSPDQVPCLASWGGGSLEFYEHVKQISCCRGSIHPPNVIDGCRRILRERGYPNRGDEQCLESMDKHSARAQSSIAPPTFYGSGQSYRPSTNASSSSRSAHAMERTPQSPNSLSGQERSLPPTEAPSKITPRKNLVVLKGFKDNTNRTGPSFDQHSTVFEDPDGYLTPADSSPLSKRGGANIATHLIFDDPPPGKENMGLRVSKPFAEAPSGLSQPRTRLAAERKRHQSVPVNLGSRNTALNQRNPSPPQRHDNALQEINNNLNALKENHEKMNRNFAVFLERVLEPPSSQGVAVQQAAAPTVAAAVEGGNRAEQPHVRKRKKPSRAERQREKPVLSRDVPEHLRVSEERLIEIGRIVNHYERHTNAPEAFGWGGNLYAEYSHLLVQQSNGVPVWTALQISRLTR